MHPTFHECLCTVSGAVNDRYGGAGMKTEQDRKPVLTAVVPVYNGERYLRETVERIRGIRSLDWELILIDDGSSDGSGAICAEFEELDDRIRCFRQENRGIAASRNRGICQAQGEYICFWDQDDILLPEGCLALLQQMQTEDAQMGMCSTERSIHGKRSGFERVQDGIYAGAKVQQELLYPLLFRGFRYDFAESSNYFYGSVWKCIFRTDFIRENHIEFKRFINYEDDWIFVTHALSLAKRAVTVSVPGYCWRVNEQSESHRGEYIEDLQERFAALDGYVMPYLEKGMAKDKAVFDAYRKVSLCEHYIDSYRNAANVCSAAERRRCHRLVRDYLRETGYREQIACVHKLRSSAYRKKVILMSLRYGGVGATFIISRIYDILERRMSSVQWIVRMERSKKMKR